MGFIAKGISSIVKKITGIGDITPIDKIVGKALRKTTAFEEKTALKLDKSFMPAPPKLQQVTAPAALPPTVSSAKKAPKATAQASTSRRRGRGNGKGSILSSEINKPTILGR